MKRVLFAVILIVFLLMVAACSNPTAPSIESPGSVNQSTYAIATD